MSLATSLDSHSVVYNNHVVQDGDSACDTLSNDLFTTRYIFEKPHGNCVNIIDSVFVGVSAGHGDGGAIYFSNDAYNASLLISQCTFTKCSSDEGRGGAIFAMTRNMSILFTCASSCSSFNGGQFVFLEKSSGGRSEINVTTIDQSSSEGDSPINNAIEKALYVQINISQCTSRDTLGTGSIKLANKDIFMREISLQQIHAQNIMTFNTYDSINDIQRINVIGNTAENSIIFFNGNWVMSDVIFAQNVGPVAKSLGDAKLTLVHCVFDSKVDIPQNVITDGCQFEVTTKTFEIGFLNTLLCAADVSATPYAPDSGDSDDDDEVAGWTTKKLVGVLCAGIAGAFVIGIVLGAVVFWAAKRKKIEHLNATPLITTGEINHK